MTDSRHPGWVRSVLVGAFLITLVGAKGVIAAVAQGLFLQALTLVAVCAASGAVAGVVYCWTTPLTKQGRFGPYVHGILVAETYVWVALGCILLANQLGVEGWDLFREVGPPAIVLPYLGMAGLVFGVLWGVESRREVKPEDRAEGRGSGSDAGQRGSVGPLVWLAAGAALLLAAFHFRELNPEYVKLVVEKARLVGERAPDDHVNPDSVEKYRPVWHSPLLLLGIGGIAVGAVQIASSLRGRVSGASRGPAEPS